MGEKYVLAINSGSSSIKFSIYGVDEQLHRVEQGEVSRIGLSDASFKVHPSEGNSPGTQKISANTFAEASDFVVDYLEKSHYRQDLIGIGHRIVHGGPKFVEPEFVTDTLIRELLRYSAFDPEHMPSEVSLMQSMRKHFPTLPQIACFDTAFHHDLPPVAKLLPIPRKYEAMGVRRYGFHGLSFQFLMQELENLDGTDVAHGKVILAHLGSGSSMAAVFEGKSLDTSMSFTPSSGLVMGTRSGDLDPGLALFLSQMDGLDPQHFNKMVNFEAGLLGISGKSSDMGDLLSLQKTDIQAAEAVEIFCYQAKKWIGSFAAVLGGIDTLVFSGGIGENSAKVRSRICEGMGFLGISLDEKKNESNQSLISGEKSRVRIRMIRTDEEYVIAKAVVALTTNQKSDP